MALEIFSTGRLIKLRDMAAKLGFWDDVFEYSKEIERRQKDRDGKSDLDNFNDFIIAI